MSENKKKLKENVAKAKNANAKNKKVNNANAKANGNKKVEEKKGAPSGATATIPFIVTAAVLVVVLLGGGIFALVDYISADHGFDYLKSDLSKYVELTEDYKNFTVNVDIAAPREDDVKISILNMLYADRDETPLHGGERLDYGVITPGDDVYVWYRGYLVGDGDEKIVVEDLSNFGKTSADKLGIGSNGLYPGFELNLLDINTKDYSRFEKITSGTVSEGQIAYITYTKTKSGDKTGITESNVRIDFSEDIDATYGAGFAEKIMGLEIGKKVDISATVNSTVYNYTNLTVNFVTECETNPIKVEAYFPYDYSVPTLRNENAVFEVYVDGIVVYDTPEFNDEYLEKKIEDEELNVTLEELEELGKDSLTANYYAYAEKLMNELYETEKKELVENEIWAHYVEISKALKYPKAKVEEIYEDYVDDIVYQFTNSGGYVYNQSTGKYVECKTIDEFAPLHLGIGAGGDWEAEAYKQAESFVKERMVMFYILRAENLVPTDEELKAERDKVYQEYLDEAIKQYLNYHGKTREDYTDEEYEEVVEECRDVVAFNFEENYFTMRSYYNILAKTAVNWPEVITLDERRAYPQDK